MFSSSTIGLYLTMIQDLLLWLEWATYFKFRLSITPPLRELKSVFVLLSFDPNFDHEDTETSKQQEHPDDKDAHPDPHLVIP